MKIENNQVTLVGKAISDFSYNHSVYGERFYTFDLSTYRTSGTADVIPVMISERLIDVSLDFKEVTMEISGQFRSYNRREENKSRLVLSVFANVVNILEEDFTTYDNQIFLDGYICKKPTYRKTLFGREVSDILLAVNRPYEKSDYIPCICWGRNARYASSFEVGMRLQINGRIQSREYKKKISDEEFETRTAYEVSISKMEEVRNEQI